VIDAIDAACPLAGCAAGAVLSPEAARIVSCATTSSGATSFAMVG